MASIAVVRPEATDSHAVKQWAAEDFAIAVGLLRECPYHGQPYKASGKGLARKSLSAGLADPLDPVVQAFEGNTRELWAAAERVTGDYRDYCPHCRASEQEAFD